MLAQGDVFFMAHRALTSPKPHFCIVVGLDNGKRVVLSFATSQYKNRLDRARRMGYPKETIVQVAANKYEAFDRFTVIDCNSVYVQDAEDFDKMVSGRNVFRKPPMPREILNRIIRGILASPRSTTEIKRLVRNAPPLPEEKTSHAPRITVSPLPR